MKKLLLLSVLFFLMPVCTASELTDDYLDMAADYSACGNYSEAMGYLKKILQLEPRNAKALKMKSDLDWIASPTSRAHLYDANYLTAERYMQTGNYQGAAAYYKKALDADPEFAQCQLGLAMSLFETGDYSSAITAVNNYLRYAPKSDAAYALRAKSHLALALNAQAENDIKTAINLNDDITYRYIEAKILYQKGNFRGAKQKFEALAGEIQTSELYKYLGLCDYSLKNYSSALLNLDKAIILSDEDKTLDAKYDEVKEMLRR